MTSLPVDRDKLTMSSSEGSASVLPAVKNIVSNYFFMCFKAEIELERGEGNDLKSGESSDLGFETHKSPGIGELLLVGCGICCETP